MRMLILLFICLISWPALALDLTVGDLTTCTTRMKKLMLAAALALVALSPAAAQRAAAPAFPTEWQGNDKWCPQSDMPSRVIYTRRDECYLVDHITLTADRYERKKLVCRLLAGNGGKHPRGRIYHAVMSCQGEHERWFECADFFTPFPADLLVVERVAQASTPILFDVIIRYAGSNRRF
jgi:hypothetical protein